MRDYTRQDTTIESSLTFDDPCSMLPRQSCHVLLPPGDTMLVNMSEPPIFNRPIGFGRLDMNDPAVLAERAMKRPCSEGAVPTAHGKQKPRGKAAEVFHALLNFFHLSDKKQTAAKDKVNRTEIIPRQIIPSEPGANLGKGLSKSWSYFSNDEFVMVQDDDLNIYYNESYFEDDYLEDYRDFQFPEATRSPNQTIRMGVSSLVSGTNDASFKTPKRQLIPDNSNHPGYSYVRSSTKRARKKHFSMPDVISGSYIPACNEETQTDVSFEDLLPGARSDSLGLNIAFDVALCDESMYYTDVKNAQTFKYNTSFRTQTSEVNNFPTLHEDGNDLGQFSDGHVSESDSADVFVDAFVEDTSVPSTKPVDIPVETSCPGANAESQELITTSRHRYSTESGYDSYGVKSSPPLTDPPDLVLKSHSPTSDNKLEPANHITNLDVNVNEDKALDDVFETCEQLPSTIRHQNIENDSTKKQLLNVKFSEAPSMSKPQVNLGNRNKLQEKTNSKVPDVPSPIHLPRFQDYKFPTSPLPPSPLVTAPTPISCSSPLHKTGARRSYRHPSGPPLPTGISPVRQRPLEHSRLDVRCYEKSKRKLCRHSGVCRSFQSSLCDTSSHFDSSSEDELEVPAPSSKDYILLKRCADAIVQRIPSFKSVKDLINLTRLIEYLNSFYIKEISSLSSPSVKCLGDLRKIKQEACDIFMVERLTVDNCISELLMSALVGRQNVFNSCRDFVFEHLHYVSTTKHFLQSPPEIILVLLGNQKSIVLGPRGFPLSYHDSEKEVLRAVTKYLDANKNGNSLLHAVTKQMLYTVVDPRFHPSQENCGCQSLTTIVKRPPHEITFHWTNVPGVTTRLEYLRRPIWETPPHIPDRFSLKSYVHEDAARVCHSDYTLRKILFTYKQHNSVPYITQITLQYSHKGRKHEYSLGTPELTTGLATSGNTDFKKYLISQTARDTPDKPPLQRAVGKEKPGEKRYVLLTHRPEVKTAAKTTAAKLASGEHVTGVILQGNAVLHNVELTTSRGRRIRAHCLKDSSNEGLWTPVSPPPGSAPYCLQALYTENRSCGYLRDVGAVWAVMSYPVN
ncbi:uncharacterized protein LOC131956286 [Physella acuta]|uniref:uncharacterized protein LOC131956286 n=1 Tax=Physella acuta TaxID=109671 RepID=UPI0027DE9512|nr:uncharacterized protein LOC131956286 [Physella acuta]